MAAPYTHRYLFDVFLSHASLRDKVDPWVLAFHGKLAEGLQRVSGTKPKIWASWEQLGAGDDFEKDMLEGVRNSAVFVAVLSPSWMQSGPCQKEFKTFQPRPDIFFAYQQKVDCLPEQARQLLYLDLRDKNGNPIGSYTKAFQDRVSALAVKIHQRLTEVTPGIDLNPLIDRAREKVKVRTVELCGTMQVLNMVQPIHWADIYCDVHVVENPDHQRDSEIEAVRKAASQWTERIGYSLSQERTPGIDVVKKEPRILLLGKPGSGKTTFLKRLAMKCSQGELFSDCVPWFLHIPSFERCSPAGKPLSLSESIAAEWKELDSSLDFRTVARAGKLLLLLDSLDEVQGRLDETRKAVEKFCLDYPHCRVVLSCRIAANEYRFQKFVEVAVADFTPEQMQTFSDAWFPARNKPEKAALFREKLRNPSIQELGTSPLLLTMLCLAFEDRDIEGDRAHVLNEGLEVLLSRWDASRSVERDFPYKRMPVGERRSLLSEIAFANFESDRFLFPKQTLEKQIRDYLKERPKLLDANEDLDAEAVLKAVEAQHGLLVARARTVYSFSHLAFQEYLTAQRIRDKQSLISTLIPRVDQHKWREVFILTASMVDGDDFLPRLKNHVDKMVAGNKRIAALQTWAAGKAAQYRGKYRREAVRAFYFWVSFPAATLALDRALDLALALARGAASHLGLGELAAGLSSLRDQLPHENPRSWTKERRLQWREDLRILALRHRDIGRDWNLTNVDINKLHGYLYANQTLVACIKAATTMREPLRQELLGSLLLPLPQNS